VCAEILDAVVVLDVEVGREDEGARRRDYKCGNEVSIYHYDMISRGEVGNGLELCAEISLTMLAAAVTVR
jgi:hypothetical protein